MSKNGEGPENLRPGQEALQSADSIIVPAPVAPIDGVTCKTTPESIDGPYYFHGSPVRSDIVEGKEGVRIRLVVQLLDTTWASGEPSHYFAIPDATIDIWQADALGIYSNVPAEAQGVDTVGETFLRGAQVTDENGCVEFQTIIPGWYLEEGGPPWLEVFGRTVHIHAKVYFRNKVLTTQFYFPNEFLDEIYTTHSPYKDTPERMSRLRNQSMQRDANEADWVFEMGGPVAAIEPADDGYVAKVVVGMFNA